MNWCAKLIKACFSSCCFDEDHEYDVVDQTDHDLHHEQELSHIHDIERRLALCEEKIRRIDSAPSDEDWWTMDMSNSD